MNEQLDSSQRGDIADPGLASTGLARIGWAERSMPVLRGIAARFAAEQPLAGLRIAACLHVTAETAVLVGALRAGGAQVFLAASNPLSTQDDIAAALQTSGAAVVYARAGVDLALYDEHIHRALDAGPDLVIDDGGDLVDTLHTQRPDLLGEVAGGCESTSTGVIRLRRMAGEGTLAFPVVAADATGTRRMLDNTYGTGQSVIDGLLRATNILLAGRTVVVAGFGWCGRGIAQRARGLGAQVIVTEVDPVRALDAVMQGYRVLPMSEAAPLGEVFITATGSRDVIGAGAPGGHAGRRDPGQRRALRRRDRRAGAGRPGGQRAPRGPPAHRRVRAGRRAAAAAAGRGPGGQPGRRRGQPGRGDGRVVRRAGAGAGLAGPVARALPARRARRCRRRSTTRWPGSRWPPPGTAIDELTPAQREYLSSWRQA